MAVHTRRQCTAVLAAVLCLLGPAPGAGQSLPNLDAEWRWVDFGPESGLPAGVVRDILEVDTVVWVRTDSAAAWYDGFQWMTPSNGSVPAGTTSSLAPDSAGGVILVQGGQTYRGSSSGFEQVLLPGLAAAGPVVRAVPYRDGGLLLSTAGDTPQLWIFQGGRAVRAEGIPGILDPTSLTLSRAGRAWTDTREGLHVLQGERWVDRIPEDRGYGLGSTVTENRRLEGFIHLGAPSLGDGMLRFEGEDPPRAVTEEAGNLLWAGDINEDGLAIMAYETGDLRVYADGSWRAIDLPSARLASVHAMHISDNGDLWFGTSHGLHLYRGSVARYSVIRTPFPGQRNRVNAIVADGDGVLWLATGGGIFRHGDGGTGEWLTEIDGTTVTSATGLTRGPDGSIWVTSGSDFEGALRWDGASWSHLDAEDGLAVGRVHRVFADSDGSMWFASLGNGTDIAPGMYRWHDGRLVPGTDLGLPASRAYGFSEGRDGTRWFAFLDGLYRIRGDSVRAWTDFSSIGLDATRLWDVSVDRTGRPWIAMAPDMARGLAYIDEDGELHLVRPPGAEGARRVWSILFEDDGAMWIGTEAGVLMLRDGVWSHFDEATGLPAVNVWPVAIHSESVFIGTKGGGLVVMNRSEADDPAPRVVIWNATPEGRALRLRHSALAYRGALQSDAIETRYRIDEGDWSDWRTVREQVIPGMTPGDHTVEVQAHGLYAQLSEPAAASFRIQPLLIFQPAFGIPVGGLALALLILGTSATLRRTRQDRELRLSEQRLRTILDHAPEAIGILDVEANRFIEANEKALALFGVDRQDLPSLDPDALMPERMQIDGGRPLRTQTDAALRGEAPVLDWIVVAGDGTEVPCELRWVRLPYTDRQLVRVSMVDTRERLRAEERRMELEAQLRQSQKLEAVGRLSGGIAHDFNNLLTIIRGNLELLVDEQPLPRGSADLVEGALDAVTRSTELSQRLLAIGRRQTLEARPIDVSELLHSMEDLLRRSLGERVELSVSPAPELWAAIADPGQLENAVLNLAINARDAMPRGGRLAIEARNIPRHQLSEVLFPELASNDYVEISVTDTGVGMSADVIARAFDPFFTTKDVGKGSGLGLSMVHGFATQSGGSARIESRPGVGSRVEMILPKSQSEVAGVARGDLEAGSLRGRGERILVVEDDPGVTKLLMALLAHLGYETTSAADAQEALFKLRGGEAVDAMLIDLVLPGSMDGAELAREARTLRPGTPVLFMSGYGEDEHPPLSVDPEGSASTFLRKPFDQDRLARHLRETLDR